jgi:hypothetical protein
MKTLQFNEFATLYCETQESTPDELLSTLRAQYGRYKPDGWMLLRCVVLDSSRLGSRVVLPFGPNNTYKVPPVQPISPRGLCSDISEVEAIVYASDVATGQQVEAKKETTP